jgi:hypothetical protein
VNGFSATSWKFQIDTRTTSLAMQYALEQETGKQTPEFSGERQTVSCCVSLSSRSFSSVLLRARRKDYSAISTYHRCYEPPRTLLKRSPPVSSPPLLPSRAMFRLPSEQQAPEPQAYRVPSTPGLLARPFRTSAIRTTPRSQNKVSAATTSTPQTVTVSSPADNAARPVR